MFVNLKRSLVQLHNEELMRVARKVHLQRSLRANREVRSIKALALGLLWRWRNSYGGRPC